MKTIYKFFIPIEDHFSIELPKDSKILTVQVQKENAFIWVLLDIEQEIKQKINFRLVGTGHPINDNIKYYIGSFQMCEGNLVFHLFELEDKC
jgi:hypothetical protein